MGISIALVITGQRWIWLNAVWQHAASPWGWCAESGRARRGNIGCCISMQLHVQEPFKIQTFRSKVKNMSSAAWLRWPDLAPCPGHCLNTKDKAPTLNANPAAVLREYCRETTAPSSTSQPFQGKACETKQDHRTLCFFRLLYCS